MTNNVTIIRKAAMEDAPFVAWTVLTALDMTDDDLAGVTESCADPNSMYSYRNALIAEEDGKSVGCLVSYRGEDYAKMREYTWGNLWKEVDVEFIRNTPYETAPGEYYLDSMAILPQYRGRNIGKILMEAAIAEGRSMGYEKFGLLVAISKPNLEKYYAGLGFRQVGDVNFFGHLYHKMEASFKTTVE